MGFPDKWLPNETACVNATLGTGDNCEGLPCYHGQCFKKYVNFLSFGPKEVHDNCTCDDGWIGYDCTRCCMLPCVHGMCDIDDHDGMLYCYCNKNYTGQYCETYIEPITTPHLPPLIIVKDFWNEYTIPSVAIPVFITLILFILSAAIPYIMYKKRNILILKILYRFKKFEDDDSRMYDVFLSYRTSNKTNRDYVVYKLLKFLESSGFKACIDERDFIPGSGICETIKVAIKESRRTILVLSPAYIEGEWPEFEVQCAIIETLSKAHRIIPIIFEPINNCENISPSLKHILESITYIEWPQDENDVKAEEEFWRRLKLSMPKKKSSVIPSAEKETNEKETEIVEIEIDENKKNDEKECAFIMDAKPGEYTNKLLFPPGSFPMPTGC